MGIAFTLESLQYHIMLINMYYFAGEKFGSSGSGGDAVASAAAAAIRSAAAEEAADKRAAEKAAKKAAFDSEFDVGAFHIP